jgi:formamidopyrimidine-DNA glycosylase
VPELPEVEHVRRSLEPALLGAAISRVSLRSPGIVEPALAPRDAPRALLARQTIAEIRRHGKQLAIIADTGRVLVIHLGMTGELMLAPPGGAFRAQDHLHAIWVLGPRGRLGFRDPRRFGGLWPLPDPHALANRWAALGPDALDLDHRHLERRSAGSTRAIKAALLDQRLLAGVGNIYADEALFLARIAPVRPAGGLSPQEHRRLARAIAEVLTTAIGLGGSTIRDYRNAQGDAGRAADRHRVYGRVGLPCTECRSTLIAAQIAQRTTVWCPRCQPDTTHPPDAS